MKKVFFLLFPGLLALLLMLSGCGAAISSAVSSSEVSEPDSVVSTVSIDLSKPMILITSNGETSRTYASVLWDNPWTGENFLCADFYGVYLPDIAERLSAVTYADDFSIQYREDITFSYIRIFNENFERLYNNVDLSDLKELPEGTYYVVIVVVKQGDYIASVSQYEKSGYECAFKLVVN